MDRCVGAAARLPESDRKDLAIQALAQSATVSDLAARHGVSRKFVYQQTRKVRAALDDAFLSATPNHEVLFEVAVTKTWLYQVIVALALICRSSYRGVVEFMRDLLSLSISVGTVHHVLQSATQQAGVINREQDLSGIRVGLHDEIFQFHIQRQCEGLANTLSRLSKGATSRRQMLQAKMGRGGQPGPDDGLATQLELARQAETQAHELARDIRTLTQWGLVITSVPKVPI